MKKKLLQKGLIVISLIYINLHHPLFAAMKEKMHCAAMCHQGRSTEIMPASVSFNLNGLIKNTISQHHIAEQKKAVRPS